MVQSGNTRATASSSRHRPYVWNDEEQHLALTASETIRNHAAFIWSVADLLRGDDDLQGDTGS